MIAPARDQHWYDRLVAIKGVRPVHAYLPTLDGERVTGYSPRMWALAKKQLHELGQDITAGEADQLLRSAYLTVIDEQLQKGRLLSAAWDHDTLVFKEANIELYGTIDPELWAATGAYLRHRLNKRLERRGLFAVMDWPAAVTASPMTLRGYFPDNHVFEQLRGSFNSLPWIERMHALLPTTGTVTVDQLTLASETALTRILGMADARVIFEEAPVFRMRIVQERKELIIYGKHTMHIYARRAQALAFNHEIGTHVVRRLHAQSGSLALLRTGLDKYELGEEGLGVLGELMAYRTLDVGLRTRRLLVLAMRYYIAGLLAGLDNAFVDSHAVMAHCEQFYAAWQQTVGRRANGEERHAIAHRQTEVLFASLLRGIGHNDQRAYFGRQACYLPSVIALCKMLAVPPASGIDMTTLFAGHFNPTREDHRHLVTTYVK